MNLCRNNYLHAYDSSITNGDVLVMFYWCYYSLFCWFLVVVLRCGFVCVMKLPCHVMCYITAICYSRFLYFVFHVHHSVLLIVVQYYVIAFWCGGVLQKMRSTTPAQHQKSSCCKIIVMNLLLLLLLFFVKIKENDIIIFPTHFLF